MALVPPDRRSPAASTFHSGDGASVAATLTRCDRPRHDLSPPLAPQHFTQYYTHRYQSRRLKWVLSQGSAEIRFQASRGRYLLQSSTMQAVVLLFFNRLADEASATGDEIASEVRGRRPRYPAVRRRWQGSGRMPALPTLTRAHSLTSSTSPRTCARRCCTRWPATSGT